MDSTQSTSLGIRLVTWI